MKFVTERLILRPFEKKDADFLFVLNNDKIVNEFRNRDTDTMENCLNSIDNWQAKYGEGYLNVYVMSSKDEKPFGMMAIFKWHDEDEAVEVGYRMLTNYWGQGYCSEAMTALIDAHSHAYGLTKYFAVTHPDNLKSIASLKRNGFTERIVEDLSKGRFFDLER